MARRVVSLHLPYPPSVNHYYRHVGPRTLISREGRAYRERVAAVVAADCVPTLNPPISLAIDIWPPDNRRRDVDNILKALLDALEHAHVYADDSQITKLSATKHGAMPGGALYCVITGT